MRATTRQPAVLACLTIVAGLFGSDESLAQWQRGKSQVEVDVQVFRSTQSFNLPTAENADERAMGI